MPDRRPLSIGRATSIGPDPKGIHSGIGPDPGIDAVMEKYGGLMGGGIAEEGGPIIRSLGKYLSELLGLEVGATKAGSGLPKRMRLTNFDSREGNLDFHAASRKGGERFQATPSQLDTLVGQGALDVVQPPKRAVESTRRKIATALDKPKSTSKGTPK